MVSGTPVPGHGRRAEGGFTSTPRGGALSPAGAGLGVLVPGPGLGPLGRPVKATPAQAGKIPPFQPRGGYRAPPRGVDVKATPAGCPGPGILPLF